MDEFDKMFGSNEPDEFEKMFGNNINVSDNTSTERTVGSTLKDLAISAGRGALEIPGMLTGLADLPIALATGNRPFEDVTNYIGEKTGIQPHKLAESMAENYSDIQKQSAEDINKVWNDQNTNALDVVKEYITHPGYVANQVVESLPSMIAGGVASKAIMGAGKVASITLPTIENVVAKQAAEKGAGFIERKLLDSALSKLGPNASQEAIIAAEQNAYKTAAAIAAGTGEGLVQAGQSMNQATGTDQRKNAIAALNSGIVDAVIGFGAGKVAQGLGLETAETAMAKSFNDRIEAEVKNGISKYGIAGKIVGGAISEGIMQELPQSAQEQIFQNYADGKPLWDGVNRSAVEGALAGFVMGAGANVLPAKDGDIKTTKEIELDRRAGNILNLKDEEITQSVQKLTENINAGQELLNDPIKLDAKARELNVAPTELIRKTVYDNKNNQDLLDKVTAGIKAKEEIVKKEYEALSPEDKAVKDIENKLIAQRQEEAQKINEDLKAIEQREEIARKQYKEEKDPVKKAAIAERAINLRKEKDALLDRQKALVENKSFAPYTTREDRQKYLEELFGTVNVGANKSAAEAARVFDENSAEQQDILDRLSKQIAATQNQQRKQELQKVYDGLFQTFERDAIESAEVFQANSTKLDEIQARIDQEADVNKKAELRKLYNGLFQTFEKDAKESADIYVKELGNVDLVKQTMDQMLQESDPVVRQKLYNQMFILPGVKNAQESAEVFLMQNFTEREKTIIENYWQEVKKELNLRNEQMTPGTEAFMRKKFFETQLDKIENNVRQDVADQAEPNKNVVPSLAEQNKRQQMFQQIAAELGDVPATNRQVVTPEIPRDLPGGLPSAFTNEQQVGEVPQFQVGENQNRIGNVTLTDIEKAFPGQTVTQSENGTISIQFKNGKGLTINNIQNAGQDLISLAIETGQMSKNGKILGITVGNNILLDNNFADNRTLWHENKHVLDNLGLITEADDSALNKEFNKLRKQGKLKFALSTHKDPVQAMRENRANMFAQIMVDRAEYRNTVFGKVIQRVMDFFNQLLSFGKQTVSGLARDVESGKVYERKVGDQTIKTTVPMAEEVANKWHSTLENVVNSIPITNRMKSKALREGMPMFEVRETPSQKLSDEEYHRRFIERNNIVRTIGQAIRMKGSEVKQLIDKFGGSTYTRLLNVNKSIATEYRNIDVKTAQAITTALKAAHPMLEKAKLMSKEDKFIWNEARKAADQVKVERIAEKYNMLNEWQAVRQTLDSIRNAAIDVGYEVGYIEEYWPRIIKDVEGFLQATKGISNQPEFSNALDDQALKLGLTKKDFIAQYPEVAADMISNMILNPSFGIGGPGNIQERKYDVIPEELTKFYMDSDAALMSYIYSMTKKIEARRFFGKVPPTIAKLKAERTSKTKKIDELKEVALLNKDTNPVEYEKINTRLNDLSEDITQINQKLDDYKFNDRNYTENIGAYVTEKILTGELNQDHEKIVKDILHARFNEHGTRGLVTAFKNASYIDVLGSPLSAITQIGDHAWAMYVAQIWTPKGLQSYIKNAAKATTGSFKNSKYLSGVYRLFGGSEITKEDLGIERIAQEFADGTTLSNAVSAVFRAVQLERMDSIGKETLINVAFDRYKTLAKTENGRKQLMKQLKPIFENESDSVINDILSNNPSDNVKMLLYHKVLDFHPISLSAMPAPYLNGGNGRVAYMLKTYTIQQFDVFRREAWHNIKNGYYANDKTQVIEGITNMIKLASLLTLANAGADEIKDWMLGKESKFSDNVIENFLTLGGASKYIRMQTTREGLGSGLIGQLLPPFRFINSISKDLNEGYDKYIANDTIKFDHARIIESIPVGGKLYYWHYGRGTDYKKSSNEQEFSEVGKDVNLFKRQFENSEDKRAFLNSNLDKFKQMKLHENFQNSLNRNQAVINKLKDLEQTTNVRERLGQLQQQRELLLNKYFEVTKMIQ